jgi:hypothetical protein
VRRTIGIAFAALALAAVPLATVTPAAARDDARFSADPASVAFGYNDGYWDRDHQWHSWANKSDSQWYRTHYKSHYYSRRHDAAKEQGWRESDRWWDRH